ncbi:hypothetical protein A3K92_02220 [Thermococcus gorgonarius]|uniref:Uncharacterized protein n=1 Tax=Thermococcus gorgonarius TaxID=71997 RepID=A0A2Z2M3S7_THEGO|nr:hypothetical protein A3K92_02220 [Thermococcus gorgonarius]
MSKVREWIAEVTIKEAIRGIMYFIFAAVVPAAVAVLYHNETLNYMMITLISVIFIILVFWLIRKENQRRRGGIYFPCFPMDEESLNHIKNIKEFGVIWPIYINPIEYLDPDITLGIRTPHLYIGRPKCPECGAELEEKKRRLGKRYLWSCPNPQCSFKKDSEISMCVAKKKVEKIHLKRLPIG